MSRNQDTTKAVTRVIMAEEERLDQMKNRLYKCTECSRATLIEKAVPLKSLQIDTEGDVVVYEFSCDSCVKKGIYDKAFSSCFWGDETFKDRNTCRNCRYSRVTIIRCRDRQKCQVTKVLYRCTNIKRMEQFTKGTLMCAYISCEHHEK